MTIDDELGDLDALLGQRTPFGSTLVAPTAPLAPFSRAGTIAADNLLSKAVARLRAGEAEAAQRLMTRAASLAYDEHEGMWPGPAMAAHALFNVLADQSEFIADFEFDEAGREDESDEEPPVAVDVGIRSVRTELDESEAGALRVTVQEVTSEGDYYGIDREQARRMHDAVQAMPEVEHPRELPADASEEQRVEMVRACCRVAVLLSDAFDE